MIKLVAFDLDGTIGDTIPLCINAFKCAVEPYTSHELSKDEIIQTFGLNEEGMIRQVTGENWQEALDDFYVYYKQMHYQSCATPFNGIMEIIQELKRKTILVALITGKGERSCSITLEQFNMNDCFDCIETGSSLYNRKAEAISKLLEKYCLQSNEFIYIGDAVSDVLACREINVKCLSAAWAKGVDVKKLEGINLGNVIPSITNLKKRLQILIEEQSL